MVSNTIKGKAEFVMFSFDVKMDGKSVPRQLDPMLGNKNASPNTPPMPELQPPMVVVSLPAIDQPGQEPSMTSLEMDLSGPEHS